MMTRILAVTLTVATPAFAHDGLHHHPHGIDFGWIVVAALGATGGWLLARLRGGK